MANIPKKIPKLFIAFIVICCLRPVMCAERVEYSDPITIFSGNFRQYDLKNRMAYDEDTKIIYVYNLNASLL